MDTSWIKVSNNDPLYKHGVIKFIELAKENLIEGRTRCPSKKCKVKKWLTINEVEQHLLFKGFYQDYDNWIYHGKGDILPRMMGADVESTNQGSLIDQSRIVGRDDMSGLLNAAFGVNIHHIGTESVNDLCSEPNDRRQAFENIAKEPDSNEHSSSPQRNQSPSPSSDEENLKYKKLLEAAYEELYIGCTSFSKLSFLLHLFHLKCMHHWTAQSFTMLLEVLVDAFPQIMDFPQSYYYGKKMINELGLGYEKIHACPNNCVLYWGDLSGEEECPRCHTPRRRGGQDKDKKGEPLKVMRYFPLIPRLKRLYMSFKTAKDMRWHEEDRVKDGMLRHPADGKAWREFDSCYPEFSADPRSVRLGLASDGFNPYRLMNTTYSVWPVVLIPYNLPPWMSMKPSSFILSIIIPGKNGPGIDIDIYMQPLLHELTLLWDEGVAAYDAYSQQWFKMRAALMWTINDFPAYAMLSGWSTKGYNACPSCTTSTPSYMFAGKICYAGCRKYLSDDHPYRAHGHLFDGTKEYGRAPIATIASEVLRQQEETNYVYGSSKKRQHKKRGRKLAGEANNEEEDVPVWSKRSIFFDLPYWQYNLLRHNLDVMHIEKNVCDILLGTILNMEKNCRDDENARKALEKLGIKKHLWIQPCPNGAPHMPPASYSMSTEEKERFLRVLQKLKVPDGFGSNLSRCVNLKERKLINLKSHDNHVLMQDILPVALRASKATKIIDLLSDLSSFFKYLCSTTLDPNNLDNAQSKLIITLCEMEKEFLPIFFTIMVHLLVHLVDEAKLGGPVQYRWMYPIERYLSDLKSHVSNKARPEGSIAEGYILRETITFCSRYLEGIETIFNRPRRNDVYSSMGTYLFNSGGRVLGKEKSICLDAKTLKQAHRYVLLHSDEMKDLFDEFLTQKRQEHHGTPIDESIQNEWIITDFSDWLQNQVHHIDDSTEEGKMRKALAGGLSSSGRTVNGYVINGYKFLTVKHDRNRKTQNSGLMVEADGEAYFGKITDIYELDYYGAYKVVLFRCDWVDIGKGFKSYANGGACVSFSKLMHTGRLLRDDPFVFSSQAKQVFYVEDETQKGWLHVVKTKPRDLFDLGEALQ